MTGFSFLSLQTALYQKLTGDTTLMALIEAVYDRPPQGSAFPYVTLGDSKASDWSTKTTTGTEHMFLLHVWSREGGRVETAAIMERIYQLLHQGSLTISGQTLVLMQLSASTIVLENDGMTYQGSLKFRALLQAN